MIVTDAERESFARDVETIGGGNPLAVCAITLDVWSKVHPPQGSMAARCAIMAEYVWQAAKSFQAPLRPLGKRDWAHRQAERDTRIISSGSRWQVEEFVHLNGHQYPCWWPLGDEGSRAHTRALRTERIKTLAAELREQREKERKPR